MPSQSIARIRSPVRIAFWGTSLTEHPAAVGARFIDQANLPGVGDAVVVEAIQCRGYVHRVEVALRIQFPTKVFQIINHGVGGATSRDVLARIQRTSTLRYDVASCEVATNDVLRGLQGRVGEAVSIEEFTSNYREILRSLNSQAARLVCVGAPPIGWAAGGEGSLDVAAANRQLLRYNASAMRCAAEAGAVFVDVWSEFVRIAGLLSGWSVAAPARPPHTGSLWHADGLHPSQDLGVELIGSLVLHALSACFASDTGRNWLDG